MTDTAFDLSAFLPYRLAVLSERVSRRLSVEYGQSHGLSMAEWRVLVHLLCCDQASVREIHAAANLDKPRVSRAVARLDGLGLLRKDQAEEDGRLVSISLTDEGRKAVVEILPFARAVEDRLTGVLSAQEMSTLLDIMERLHRVLDRDPLARPRPGMNRQTGLCERDAHGGDHGSSPKDRGE